jgi:putative oxidoreductase
MITRLAGCYNQIFDRVQRSLEDWFLGLAARFVFAGVLLVYLYNSALTKVGDGLPGFFTITDNAYIQILPGVVERFDYDASLIPFFPYDIIVVAGTYSEFILPALIVIGLFTRVAALGMIGFVAVQSFVDINFHGADEKTTGALFDRFSDSLIVDQRSLWVFLLIYLVIRGPGLFSLDSFWTRKGVTA